LGKTRKTKSEVIQAVGRADRTSDEVNRSYWFYDEKALDTVSGIKKFCQCKN
jgi:hypothetical protein